MIIGHSKQLQFLKKSAELGRIPHAILFCGQEQLGKKTLAIEFAKSINNGIENDANFDFILLGPKDGPSTSLRTSKGEIQISQVRDLIWRLSLKSYTASFKIAIIDNAHLMTNEAQSCFLKLLEEPKGDTILILITSHPGMILPTIRSRVQELKFFPVSAVDIKEYLESQKISYEKTKHILSVCLGRPGKAIELASDQEKLNSQNKIIADLLRIQGSDLAMRFQYAKDLLGANYEQEDERESVKKILDVWLGYFRTIFLFTLSEVEGHGTQSGPGFSSYPLPKLANIIKLIQSTDHLFSTTNINQKLAFELLLLEI